MKKLIIFAGAMLLLAAGTVGFFASRPMSAQEALILRNVEAIAQGENAQRTCESKIKSTEKNVETFYCDECDWVKGEETWDSSTKTCRPQ